MPLNTSEEVKNMAQTSLHPKALIPAQSGEQKSEYVEWCGYLIHPVFKKWILEMVYKNV